MAKQDGQRTSIKKLFGLCEVKQRGTRLDRGVFWTFKVDLLSGAARRAQRKKLSEGGGEEGKA